jgi:hypothetical protein
MCIYYACISSLIIRSFVLTCGSSFSGAEAALALGMFAAGVAALRLWQLCRRRVVVNLGAAPAEPVPEVVVHGGVEPPAAPSAMDVSRRSWIPLRMKRKRSDAGVPASDEVGSYELIVLFLLIHSVTHRFVTLK